MDKTTEYYYKIGKLPKWIYNQLNGKTAQENYQDYFLERQQKNIQEQIDQKELEKKIGELLEQKLEEILQGFQI